MSPSFTCDAVPPRLFIIASGVDEGGGWGGMWAVKHRGLGAVLGTRMSTSPASTLMRGLLTVHLRDIVVSEFEVSRLANSPIFYGQE